MGRARGEAGSILDESGREVSLEGFCWLPCLVLIKCLLLGGWRREYGDPAVSLQRDFSYGSCTERCGLLYIAEFVLRGSPIETTPLIEWPPGLSRGCWCPLGSIAVVGFGRAPTDGVQTGVLRLLVEAQN